MGKPPLPQPGHQLRRRRAVEFLLDRSGGFYFMEMNTRIQVTPHHGNGDRDRSDRRTAADRRGVRSVRQEDIRAATHECRINAEMPANFRPAPGRITGWLPRAA